MPASSAGKIKHRQTERPRYRGQHFRRRVLAPALEFGQILRRHPGADGDIGDAFTAVPTLGPQLPTDDIAPERFGRLDTAWWQWDDLAHGQ